MHTNQPTINIQDAARPGLWRVLASMFYDLWLVLAIWLIGVTIDSMIRHALTGSGYAGNHLLLQIYLLVSPGVFFAWFWTHGGQTLGMRAWRIRVVTTQGQTLTWKQAALRYTGAIFSLVILGLGYLWIYIDKNKASWHDKLSGSCLVMVRKNK